MTSGLLVLFVGLGCYPITSLPTPIPMAQSEQLDVGCSVVDILKPVPNQSWAIQCHSVFSLENREPETASRVVGEPLLEWKPMHSEFGLTVHATGEQSDGKPAYGFGLSQRIWFLEEEPVMVGFQGDLGTTWFQVGVPIVFQPNDWFHVYTRPAYYVPLGYMMPLGITARVGEFLFSTEYRFGLNKYFPAAGSARKVAHQSLGFGVSWRPKGLEPIEVR